MGSIFGIVNRHGNAIDHDVFRNSFDTMNLWKPDYSGECIIDNIAFGAGVLHDHPENKFEVLPFIDNESKCCIVSDSRLDYREQLINKLNINNEAIENIPDSRIILAAYLKFGIDCVKHLYGDFAFAIWDSEKELLFCARDHFGVKALSYYEDEEYFVFSCDTRSILSLPYIKKEICDEMILDSLMGLSPNKDLTAYKSIYHLLPAHYQIVPLKGKSSLVRYWDLNLGRELVEIDDNQASQELRRRFEEAVKERCKSKKIIGIELSGGLDSTSIASIVSRYASRQNISVVTFTNTLKDSQYAYSPLFRVQQPIVKEIGNQFSFDKQIFLTGDSNEGLYSALERACFQSLEPLYHGMSSTLYQLYERANREGVNVLFSGFGGDEGITSGAPGYYTELIRQWEFNTFMEQLRKHVDVYGGSFARKFLIYVVLAWFPRLRRYIEWFRLYFLPFTSRYRASTIPKKFRRKYKTKARFIKETIAPRFKNVKDRQYYRIMHNHIPDRLEESFLCAQSYRIAYRFPFFDVKLIEYYYSLPTRFKHNNGYGRWIFRKAMEELLPNEICWQKRKEGPVIPYGLNLIQADEAKFRKIINEGRIHNQFHYIDYDKLDRILNQLTLKESRKKMLGSIKVFRNSICVLFLQKWQREGKIDIGIKC